MVQSLKKAGLGSLELFCMGLKATGCYLARTLSYTGADFQMEKIHLDPSFRWVLRGGGGGLCCQSAVNVVPQRRSLSESIEATATRVTYLLKAPQRTPTTPRQQGDVCARH